MGRSDNGITWQIEIPLLNNLFILSNVAKAIALTLAILFGFFGPLFFLQSGMPGLMSALVPCLGLGAFFILVSILTLAVILRNRYALEFIVDDDGLTMNSRCSRAKKIHRLAFILGILTRRGGTAGAGALGIAGETFFCSWKGIKSVRLYPGKFVVAARQNFIQTMYVFCNQENFRQVAERINKKVDG